MSFPTTFEDLHVVLNSENRAEVLDACWEAFDLGQRAADAVVWEPGVDEVRALAAAQACAAGRALLPLPRGGAPLPLTGDPEENAEACAVLLRRAQQALAALGRRGGEVPLPGRVLTEAADLARDAAEGLAGRKPDVPCP